MKCVAKITVFLMAVTALEASRLGSPREVSEDSSADVVWTCCVVVAMVIVPIGVVLLNPSSKPTADLPTSTPKSTTNTSILSLI
jgi:hypothetical protein